MRLSTYMFPNTVCFATTKYNTTHHKNVSTPNPTRSDGNVNFGLWPGRCSAAPTQCCGLPLGGSKPARARDVESRPRSGMHALQYASCTQITPRCRCDRKPPPLLETHTHPTNDVLNRDVPAVSDEKTNLTRLVRRPHVSKPKQPTNDALTQDVPVLVDGKANLMHRILHSATTTMS
jgi:hypothetical protein